MSAKENILKHLLAGGTITKIEAIYPPFRTTNLGDAILHIRRDGHKVEKQWKETPDGKRFAEYRMERNRNDSQEL